LTCKTLFYELIAAVEDAPQRAAFERFPDDLLDCTVE
jgi:hypothetical protein